MQTVPIQIDRKQARELYRKYKEHVHYSRPIDHEIRRTYQLIAQGRVVIRAMESVKAAGLNADNLPKLAICRADAEVCYLSAWRDGSCRFSVDRWSHASSIRRNVEFPAGSMAFPQTMANRWGSDSARATVPIIPVHLRPKRALSNYHVLWEAEWTRIPPVDPILLRRIGKGDMWLVVAAWDLTPVEQAALAARING